MLSSRNQKRYYTSIYILRIWVFFFKNFFRRKIILIGIPDYTNIGDTAISEASEKWIKSNFSNYSFIGLQEKYYLRIQRVLPAFIRKSDILFLQGGGNMGDRYPGLEGIRREITITYPHNKVVFMPVTIYFSENENGRNELNLSKIAYNSHSDLSILTRDEGSATFAKIHFNNAKIIEVPDIVCSKLETGFIPPEKKRNGKILMCKRNDVEINSSFDTLVHIAGLQSSEFIYQDTELWNNMNEIIFKTAFTNYHEQIRDLYKIFDMFSECEVVVTDRYHGLIFSYITKTPCVVLDNSDHKIREGVKWFRDCNYIFYAGNDLSMVRSKIEKAQQIQNCVTSEIIAHRYKELKNELFS